MREPELEKIVADRENFARILDNLMEGIIAHDKKRRIIFFNRTAERITGYLREQVLNKDCHDVFGGPFCGGRCSFKDGAPCSWEDKRYPLNIIARDGHSRRIEMTVTGMTDSQGRFSGVIAAFKDVTDLIGLKIQTGALRGFGGIIGRDPKMIELYKQIRNLATNDYPVHIKGETGTGKELVSAAIHQESRRGGGPFVPVNCGALPEGVLESELFGHVKGAFSGAIRDKKGRFELAHEGTLFLDEVADIPPHLQVKLLRVLQDGTFERVGEETSTSVDVRIISATNRDLKKEVKEKRFREDLYYRINVVPINLPPLRDRKDDIPLLVEHFLKEAKGEGHESSGFSEKSLAIMLAYPWPGNVRELQSAVRYALVSSKGGLVEPRHLPLELRELRQEYPGRHRPRKLDVDGVRAVLSRTGGNKARAARLLGVGRATLYRFLAEFPNIYEEKG